MPAACRSNCRPSQQRIVVNCGLPATGRENWRQVARATAAHSTVTFNDTSSCRFLESGPFKRMLRRRRWSAARARSRWRARTAGERHRAARLARRLRRPLRRRAPARARCWRPTATASTARTCSCPPRANMIPPGRDEFAVRFHLHPSVQGQPAGRRPRRHADAAEQGGLDLQRLRGRVEIEESVYLAGTDGPRRTLQIVIYGRARKVPRVQWTLAVACGGPGRNDDARRGQARPRRRTATATGSRHDRTCAASPAP